MLNFARVTVSSMSSIRKLIIMIPGSF